MNKENDYFLELMSNPTFSPKDFQLVGLDSENTGIQDKSVYKTAKIVQDNPLFQTDGKFDESKFDLAYEQALYQYNDLARLTQAEKPFFRDNIFAPDTLKGSKDTPEFEITKVQNPLRQQESFVNFGVKEAPTQSVREIAESNPTFDFKTGKWTDSPNDTWFDNFINPKVLAQWDFDADENGNPTNDPNEIVFHKGEKKIDPTTGTYYYETLGDRNIYGREVLSGFDTLTTDGSTANKFDFFDSDDLDKSVAGSMARAVAQIAPVFIPYVGEFYIGSRIAISLGELIPTVGKIFTGSDNEFLSKIEGINKAMSFSTSDYTQGSQEAGIEANPWTMETGLKLVADVFTQLAEQRWIFKYGSALFSGVNPKLIGETEAAQVARQELLEARAAKNGFNLEKVLGNSTSKENIALNLQTEQAINFERAKLALDKQLKNGQELSKKLSMAYMTGITTASSYGEAKQQGASDTEAALFALGYTAGEYALLNTEIGKWILPELKLEKYGHQQLARNLSRVTREAGDANVMSVEGKRKWYQKLFDFGKSLAKQDYSDSALTSASKMTLSSMLSEGIEETSEEALLDMSKTIFNVANSLRGDDTRFDDAWENMATRYGMSFIGGTIGGGIATALPGYRAARQSIKDKVNNAQSNSDAYKQFVHLIANGQQNEFLDTMNKMDLGNKYLSTRMIKNSDGTVSYEAAKDYEDSQDYAIKQELTKQANIISDIMNSEGAKISTDSLINDKLIRRELKYHSLLNSNVLGVYTNEFNNLLSDLVDTSKQVQDLENIKVGNDPTKTDLHNKEDKKEFSKSDEENLNQLKKKQKQLRDRLEQYKNGEVANEFIEEALFELDTQISSAYAPTDFRRWAEDESGKKYADLSDTERNSLKSRWKDAAINRRDIIHRAYQVFNKNQQALSNVLKKHEEEYFQKKDNVLKNLESIFMNMESNISNSENVIENTQDFLPYQTRLMIWEGLLNNMKNDLNDYDSFKNTFDELGKTYAQSLNIEKLPTTMDEFNQLTPEEQERLTDSLDEEPVTDEGLKKAIEATEKEYNFQKYEDFKSGWSIFLGNTQVQEQFIKNLKEAKYITPTTKQYLKDFINKSDITDEGKTELNQALEEVANSPIEELLSNMVSTLRETGIDTTGMVTDLAKFMNDLANSSNIENFSYSPEIDQKIRKTLDLIEIAHSHIEASKTEIVSDLGNLYGYNATVNELHQKYPIKDKTHENLTTLQSSTANSLMYELANIKKDLKFYQTIFNTNSNNKLTDHIKTDLKLNSLYFGNLKTWSTEIPDDWEGKTDFDEAITQATTIQSIISDNKTSLTLDERKAMNKERLDVEHKLHELFQKNKDKDIKSLIRKFNFVSPAKTNLLNSGTESQSDRDFIWHLANIAANDPALVANEFKNAISSKYAPIIGQEEAIKRAYSYILNPEIFEKFAQAYNEVYKEQLTAKRTKEGDTDTHFDTDEYIMSTRHFLIEGIPGSGKTSGVYNTLYSMLKTNHPELLQKIWFVSNSKQNAEEASKNMENVTAMSKEEYFRKIGIGYNQEYDENGLIKLDESKLIKDENGLYHFKDTTLNEGIEAPTLIFFDEVSSFSQQDLLFSEDFLKKKGIYAFASGDFDQIGAQGVFKNSDEDLVYTRLSNSNFIGSWKLGSSMRSNNVYKSKNISIMREAIKDIHQRLINYVSYKSVEPIQFSYYESNEEGLFGDKVVDNNNVSDQEATIKTMLDTLNEGEQINFIYDDSSTQLYQTLKALNQSKNYKDKINFISAAASQGQEGQYYIIELTRSFENTVRNLSGNPDKEEEAISFAKTVYTAISRAKQGSLIAGDYSNDTYFPLFTSTKQNTLQKWNLSQEVIQNFGTERKNILENILGEITETTKLNRNVPTQQSSTTTNNEEDEEFTQESVQRNNMDKPSTIKNDEEGKLNVLFHSFLCQETGCDIEGSNDPTDPDAILHLGRFSNARIDNLNGLAQIDKRSGGRIKLLNGVEIKDGAIVKGKDELLKALNIIRNLSCYYSDKDSLINQIKKQLGTDEEIKIDFIYKNQYKDYKDDQKTLKWYEDHPEYQKFYKGKSEYLAGIFNENNTNSEIREPKDQTISILISLKDNTQLLEIPLVKMTSPLTLLNTSGFEALRQVFEDVNQDISEFKKDVKNLLKNNSSIPHIKEFAKMLELYVNSAFNTVSYLPADFMLGKHKVSGITTVSNEKGGEYFKNLNYYYDGKWVSLDEYKQRMPWRKMTRIFASVETDGRKVVDINGQEVKVGNPFVLVSDVNLNMSDQAMLETYIKQCKDKSQPKIRLVYVTPPTATMQEYIFNLNNALTKNKSNMKNVDKDLGNKITAFRLLQFALADGSKFREAFKAWNESSPTADKTSGINRMEAVSNLVKALSNYEKTEGSSKLYDLLNKYIKDVDRNIVENFKYVDEENNEKWIQSTSNNNLTLRHVLQMELHKMLLSDLFYGDSLSSAILTKKGEDIVFPDKVKNKVDAFVQDSVDNGWKGVQFHLKLKNKSTSTIEGFSFAEIDTTIGKDYSVSEKPIQINGKLDATSIEMEVSSLLDWIIKGGLGRDVDTLNPDKFTTDIFETNDKNVKLKATNTSRYLHSEKTIYKNPLDEKFKKLTPTLNFSSKTEENRKKLNEAFEKLSDDEKESVLADPRKFIYQITKHISRYVDGDLVISTNLKDVNNVIFLKGNAIFTTENDSNTVYTFGATKTETVKSLEELDNLMKGKEIYPDPETLSKFKERLTPKSEPPTEDPTVEAQQINESKNAVMEIIKSKGIPLITADMEEKTLNSYMKNDKLKGNSKKGLDAIWKKNTDTFEWELIPDGLPHAVLMYLVGPWQYLILKNPTIYNVEEFTNLIQEISKNKDFIEYVRKRLIGEENESCSVTRKI